VDAQTGERRSWGELSDKEERYRHRYVDLAVHPERREVFRRRALLVSGLRAFLDGEGFTEVETPALQPMYGGASARPFVTHHHALDRTMYLRIADELYLKRLVAGGMERVYEISKDFRNEGIDRSHNPEFTMLEFYQAFADYGDMMEMTERLLTRVARSVTGGTALTFGGKEISLEPPYTRARFTDLLEAALGRDPLGMTDEEARSALKGRGVNGIEDAGRGRLLDKLFSEFVEHDLQEPTFVTDHPLELSPLAKVHRSDPALTERFELYVAGMELANAFSELTDPVDQRARFEMQRALGAAGDEEAQPIDEDYLQAMEYGMPPIGGVGVGVDRLAMILLDQPSIRDVILFPVLREEDS
jgi:lysyl-tRNA synthetase class 2